MLYPLSYEGAGYFGAGPRSRIKPGSATTAGGSRTLRRSATTIRSGSLEYDVKATLEQIHDHHADRWVLEAAASSVEPQSLDG